MLTAAGEYNEYLIVLVKNESPVVLDQIEIGDVKITPVALADVILYLEKVRIILDGVYGRLPNGVVLLAIIDNDGILPKGDLDLKIILNAFTEDDFPEIDEVLAIDADPEIEVFLELDDA